MKAGLRLNATILANEIVIYLKLFYCYMILLDYYLNICFTCNIYTYTYLYTYVFLTKLPRKAVHGQ